MPAGAAKGKTISPWQNMIKIDETKELVAYLGAIGRQGCLGDEPPYPTLSCQCVGIFEPSFCSEDPNRAERLALVGSWGTLAVHPVSVGSSGASTE
jgi:hypothetical protein